MVGRRGYRVVGPRGPKLRTWRRDIMSGLGHEFMEFNVELIRVRGSDVTSAWFFSIAATDFEAAVEISQSKVKAEIVRDIRSHPRHMVYGYFLKFPDGDRYGFVEYGGQNIPMSSHLLFGPLPYPDPRFYKSDIDDREDRKFPDELGTPPTYKHPDGWPIGPYPPPPVMCKDEDAKQPDGQEADMSYKSYSVPLRYRG